MKQKICLAAAALLCTLAVPAQASAMTQAAVPAASMYSVSASVQDVWAQVNAVRAQNGRSALTLDANMNRAAAVRAAELAQRFAHTRPNGARGLTALDEAGVSYRTAGENIASGQQTAQAVVSAWMASPSHRQNILSASFDRMGVGQATIGGRTYWVQLFAG